MVKPSRRAPGEAGEAVDAACRAGAVADRVRAGRVVGEGRGLRGLGRRRVGRGGLDRRAGSRPAAPRRRASENSERLVLGEERAAERTDPDRARTTIPASARERRDDHRGRDRSRRGALAERVVARSSGAPRRAGRSARPGRGGASRRGSTAASGRRPSGASRTQPGGSRRPLPRRVPRRHQAEPVGDRTEVRRAGAVRRDRAQATAGGAFGLVDDARRAPRPPPRRPDRMSRRAPAASPVPRFDATSGHGSPRQAPWAITRPPVTPTRAPRDGSSTRSTEPSDRVEHPGPAGRPRRTTGPPAGRPRPTR